MSHGRTFCLIIFSSYYLLQLHHYYMQERYRKSQEGKTAKWMAMQNLKFDPRLEARMKNELISSTTTDTPSQPSQAEDDESPPSPFEYREGEETQPINLVNWVDEKEQREEKKSKPKTSAVKRPSSIVFNTEREEDDASSSVKLRKRYISTRRSQSEPQMN